MDFDFDDDYRDPLEETPLPPPAKPLGDYSAPKVDRCEVGAGVEAAAAAVARSLAGRGAAVWGEREGAARSCQHLHEAEPESEAPPCQGGGTPGARPPRGGGPRSASAEAEEEAAVLPAPGPAEAVAGAAAVRGSGALREDATESRALSGSPALGGPPAAPLPELNEAAFVVTDAAVRSAEYDRLREWFASGRGFDEEALARCEPWFAEILMDKDPGAFCAACRSVAAHYAAVSARGGGEGAQPKVVQPVQWLPALGERLREDPTGPLPRAAAGPPERAAAAELVRAAAGCLGARRFWRLFRQQALAGEDVRVAGALQLLNACAERGVVAQAEVVDMLQEFDACILNSGGGAASSSLQALVTAMPSLRRGLPWAEAAGDGDEAAAAAATGVSPARTAAGDSPQVHQPACILQVLAEAPRKTWKERLRCLEGLGALEADQLGGAALWPALALQCEDEHPAVTSAALHAAARLAVQLGAPGDLLAARLAKVVRARLRQSNGRAAEAAVAFLAALARGGVLGPRALAQFLAQALSCSKEQARSAASAAAAAALAEAEEGGPGAAGTPALPPALEALVQAAGASSRREARGPSSTPGSGCQSPLRLAAASTPPSRTRAPHVASPDPGAADVPPLLAYTPDRDCAARRRGHGSCKSPPGRTPAQTPSRYAHLTTPPDLRLLPRSPDESAALLPTTAGDDGGGTGAALASTPPRRSPPPGWASGSFAPSPESWRGPVPPPPPPLLAEGGPGAAAPGRSGAAAVPGEGALSRAASSLAGPQLRAESRFMSSSRVHLSGATVRGSFQPPARASSLPPAAPPAAGGRAGAWASAAALAEQEERSAAGAGGAACRVDGGVRARAADLHAEADAALRALEGGGGAAAWHEVLRALAAWEAGEAVRDLADSVVRMLLEAAPRIPVASQPEIWRALTELRGAPWLQDHAVLELAVGHSLGFMEPRVVAAFLSQHVADGRMPAAVALDGCLERLQLHGRGAGGSRLANLLLALAQELCAAVPAGELLLPSATDASDRSASLPSLEAVVEAALDGRIAAAAMQPLRAALELLLERLPPSCAPEDCWPQLLRLLGLAGSGRSSGPRASPPECSPAALRAHASPAAPAWSTPASGPQVAPATPGPPAGPLPAAAATAPAPAMGSPEVCGELAAVLGRVDRLTLELARAEGEEVGAKLRELAEVLRRPQWVVSLRAFLRRLLHCQRQRAAAKENSAPAPPAQKPGAACASAAEFLDDDYAGVREVYIGDGLAGAFPHSLLGHLKRLLRAPTAAETHRAAVDCLCASALACGPLLLRLVLRHFGGGLLRAAAARGPAQAVARATLTRLAALSDSPDPEAVEFRPRWLRLVWRALSQAACGRGSPGALDAGLLCEALRWLADDALRLPDAAIGASDSRDLLGLVASAAQHRGASGAAVRAVAARALQRLAIARCGEAYLQEDIQTHPGLSESARDAALLSLAQGAPLTPPAAPVQRFSWSPAGDARRLPVAPCTPGSAATAERPAARSPAGGVPAQWSAAASRARAARPGALSERPRRLQFSPADEGLSPELRAAAPRQRGSLAAACLARDAQRLRREPAEQATSPDSGAASTPEGPAGGSPGDLGGLVQADASFGSPPPPCAELFGSPGASAPAAPSPLGATPAPAAQELEAELAGWAAALAAGGAGEPTAWGARAAALRARLEDFFLRKGGANAAPVVVGTLELGERLARRAAAAELLGPGGPGDAHQLLAAAAAVASAAGATFGASTLRELGTPAVAAAFRAVLRTLSQLQQLSRLASEALRPTVAPALMELPPLLARMMDALDAPVQLVAWVRVGGEMLEEPSAAEWAVGGDGAAVRRWALRFCTRCIDRCLPQLRPGGAEFPAWEVFSQLSRLHDRQGARPADAGWCEDCDAWRLTLESAVRAVSLHYPEQTREFLLLARCTGSPLPVLLEGQLGEAEAPAG